MNVSPRDKEDLRGGGGGGGCMVCCHPEHYPSAEDLRRIREHPGFRVAVGIHPRHAGKVGDSQVRRLKQLVANPGVEAMGEIVLHIRPASVDPEVIRQAYHRASMVMRRIKPGYPAAQLHWRC